MTQRRAFTCENCESLVGCMLPLASLACAMHCWAHQTLHLVVGCSTAEYINVCDAVLDSLSLVFLEPWAADTDHVLVTLCKHTRKRFSECNDVLKAMQYEVSELWAPKCLALACLSRESVNNYGGRCDYVGDLLA
jgi:hypothetical protein